MVCQRQRLGIVGLLDGLLDGWIAGWVDCWMGGLLDGCVMRERKGIGGWFGKLCGELFTLIHLDLV
jgi:hypothetical protein